MAPAPVVARLVEPDHGRAAGVPDSILCVGCTVAAGPQVDVDRMAPVAGDRNGPAGGRGLGRRRRGESVGAVLPAGRQRGRPTAGLDVSRSARVVVRDRFDRDLTALAARDDLGAHVLQERDHVAHGDLVVVDVLDQAADERALSRPAQGGVPVVAVAGGHHDALAGECAGYGGGSTVRAAMDRLADGVAHPDGPLATREQVAQQSAVPGAGDHDVAGRARAAAQDGLGQLLDGEFPLLGTASPGRMRRIASLTSMWARSPWATRPTRTAWRRMPEGSAVS